MFILGSQSKHKKFKNTSSIRGHAELVFLQKKYNLDDLYSLNPFTCASFPFTSALQCSSPLLPKQTHTTYPREQPTHTRTHTPTHTHTRTHTHTHTLPSHIQLVKCARCPCHREEADCVCVNNVCEWWYKALGCF